MTDTKEQILTVALKLFSKRGYEAVSVSEIAGELGITKGALYRHYKNKRDIFDSIVKRMFELDKENSQQHDMPTEKYKILPQEYRDTTVKSIKSFTAEQFKFWTQNEFAACFRKMLQLEQHNNSETAELYDSCLVSGPVRYMADIFAELMKNGILKKDDSHRLAVEFYAPVFLLINMYSDQTATELTQLLEKIICAFFDRYALND